MSADAAPLPLAGTLMGFDVGTKRTGIAVGNTLTGTATPLEVAPAAQLWSVVDRLVAQWQPDGFVVGLPRQADGADTHGTAPARRFASQLRHRAARPVVFVDERYSSVEAESRHGSRIAADHHAAAILLQQYLDRPDDSEIPEFS